MKRKLVFKIFGFIVAAILVVVSAVPFIYVFTQSFVDGRTGFTALGYYDVFLASPQYLNRFWSSLGLCLAIVTGQIVVSVMGGYGFAKCKFRGRQVLFFALMMIMILPLQVTLVPNYIVLDEMGLLDTYWALVLPAIFAPLGTFIMTQSFKSVPDSIIEAAKLDGASLPQLIMRVMVPMNMSGVVCTILLSFLDGWNMVEQPITYIKEFARYPISVALAYAPPSKAIIQLVCCILVIIPPMFLFTFFNKELIEGITLADVKE